MVSHGFSCSLMVPDHYSEYYGITFSAHNTIVVKRFNLLEASALFFPNGVRGLDNPVWMSLYQPPFKQLCPTKHINWYIWHINTLSFEHLYLICSWFWWFCMVSDGFLCSLMVSDGTWWYLMVPDDPCWFLMVTDPFSWSLMFHDGPSWSLTV